jgi:hypothetical protein
MTINHFWASSPATRYATGLPDGVLVDSRDQYGPQSFQG